MRRLETLPEIEVAIAEERARLAGYLADLRERGADGRDVAVAEVLARAARVRLDSLQEHCRWLCERKVGETRKRGAPSPAHEKRPPREERPEPSGASG